MSDIIQRTDDAISLIEIGDAKADQVLSAMAFKEQLREQVKELCDRLENAVREWIVKNGPIQDGTKRYYVGPEKTTKCEDPREVLAVMLEEGGPDLVMRCLRSDPFKHATAKTECPRVSDLFKTTERVELKTGKPKMKVKAAIAGTLEEEDE